MKPRTFVLAVGLLAASACDKSGSAKPTEPSAAEQGPVVTTAAQDDGEGGGPAPDATAAAGDGSDPAAEPDFGGAGDGGGVAAEPSGPVDVPKDPAAEITEPKSMAVVKFEIRREDGKVHREKSGQIIDWSKPTRVVVDFLDDKHEFIVELTRDGKSDLDVQLGYSVGGSEVLRDHRFQTKTKKREVIRIEGGAALALTVTPTTIKPRIKANTREKLEGKKGDAPLSGTKRKTAAKPPSKKKKSKKK